MHPRVAMGLAAYALPGPLADDGAAALDRHEDADHAEKDDVGERHHQVDLADLAQRLEEEDAGGRAGRAADQHDAAHLEVHGAPAPMRDAARDRGGDDLVGLGGDRHGRRNADEDQERGHQETAADPEHARQKPHGAAHTQQQENVDRQLGDGQVDLHSADA